MTELRHQRCGEIEHASRRFPPPWTVEELNNACFSATRTVRRSAISIAANIAELPELLRKP